MGLFNRLRNNATKTAYKMIVDEGEGFYSWDGNIYKSDIVRAAIRPTAQALGKTVGKHLRVGSDGFAVNPDPYMRFLLEEPNSLMTGQMLQEKLALHLELNNNAFAYIDRDENEYPIGIYPITTTNCRAIKSGGVLYIEFTLRSGKTVTFKYSDIIHLRKDFNTSDIFGDSPASVLTPLMEIVTTTDQGIVKAIKNSNVIRWLLKFNQSLRDEDIKKNTANFVKSFLNTETSETVGAAGVDAKADATQIEPKDYVPNATQMDKTTKRIYSFLNTNEKIVQGTYNENEWISYYESKIEPIVMQLSGEYTRKLFSRKQRGFGNKVVFESANLTYASMQTKLNLVQYVDRGILNPNEVREILNMAPREGGDEYIRRLDTRPTSE